MKKQFLNGRNCVWTLETLCVNWINKLTINKEASASSLASILSLQQQIITPCTGPRILWYTFLDQIIYIDRGPVKNTCLHSVSSHLCLLQYIWPHSILWWTRFLHEAGNMDAGRSQVTSYCLPPKSKENGISSRKSGERIWYFSLDDVPIWTNPGS